MENQYLDSNLDGSATQYKEYANFGYRLLAYIIDAILLYVVQMGVLMAFGVSAMASDPDILQNGIPTSFWLAYGAVIVLQWLYFAYFESSEKQGTFGKQALGLVVTDMNGGRISFAQATGRYFSKLISAIIILIGFLMQPFTQKKQALHDMIAGTLVYKK